MTEFYDAHPEVEPRGKYQLICFISKVIYCLSLKPLHAPFYGLGSPVQRAK